MPPMLMPWEIILTLIVSLWFVDLELVGAELIRLVLEMADMAVDTLVMAAAEGVMEAGTVHGTMLVAAQAVTPVKAETAAKVQAMVKQVKVAAAEQVVGILLLGEHQAAVV